MLGMWKIKGVKMKAWVKKSLVNDRLERGIKSDITRIGKNPHFLMRRLNRREMKYPGHHHTAKSGDIQVPLWPVEWAFLEHFRFSLSSFPLTVE